MHKLILVFLLACTACTTRAQDPGRVAAPGTAAPAASTAPAGPAAPAGDTLARLRSMVADATCTLPEHCSTVPVGAVACGGPQGYLPFSTLRTNEKAVRELADRYKVERQAEIKASGLMSNCRYMPDPGAVCTSGTCQLGGGSPAAR